MMGSSAGNGSVPIMTGSDSSACGIALISISTRRCWLFVRF